MHLGNPLLKDNKMIICVKLFISQCSRCERYYLQEGSENAQGFGTPEDAEKQLKQDGWTFEGNECYCTHCMGVIREERKKRREQGE